MRAAVLTQHNRPLTLADVEPMPLEYGQVLVRVLASGICGAQLQEIRGEKGAPLPHLLGHEGCGEVVEAGPGITRTKKGDRVVLHWRKAAGIESAFPNYRYDGQTITSGLITTFSQFVTVSENRLTPVPKDTPTELCAMLGCGLSTALATIEQECRKLGERVLLIGVGGLGLNLLSALDLVTPSRVCACDIHETKRRRAELFGADYVNLNSAKISGKFDLVLDTAGSPGAMETALEHLAPSGRYLMIGQPSQNLPVCINNARHLFEGEGKTIRATQAGGFVPDVDIPRYLRIAESLSVHNTITHRVSLENINHGIDLVKNGEAGRVLVEMT